ncbi:beta/gamma crystallin family protein [Duganella aceris]|uniref:Beta/gamma crystallin family protein n=1 Tax=Duganella aceris TaxID=2703883 RepID=A0ABX0FTF1_9BURK|nr:beta/gamma crystallin family protein [Duganella aceris]NGZ87734.1 beta/gamma crystallin family protein [Duganella aceris]
MKPFFSRLIQTASLATALLAGAAHAGELTLFTDSEFRGPSISLRDGTPDLVQRGFNDRTSSVVVRSGTWELCEHAGFQGHCIVLERGEYRVLEGFNDKVSSVREISDRGDRGDRGGRGGRGDHDGRREPIVLFAQAGFGGRRAELHNDVRKLDDYDFNDRAGSVIVNEGEWELCEHAEFRGHCIVLRPGRYEFLDDMNNRISSLRRVR